MKSWVGCLLCLLLLGSSAWAAESRAVVIEPARALAVKVSSHLGSTSDQPGYLRGVDGAGETVFYARRDLLEGESFQTASLVRYPASDLFAVVLKTSARGRGFLADATEAHVGKPLALVDENGDILFFAVIRHPITEGALEVTGPGGRAAAEALFERLTGRN